MGLTASIKQSICHLFEVHDDENGVQRVITPLEYAGTTDRIVVRVRPRGDEFQVDENGEAAFRACMSGGDVETEAIYRWAKELPESSPVSMNEDEALVATTTNQKLIAAYIFRVAEAAQQLHALATARAPRAVSDFKNRVAQAVEEAAAKANLVVSNDIELEDIAGEFKADHVIHAQRRPLIVIAATGVKRLLEAELIHSAYRHEGIDAYVIAAVDGQQSVGTKQFERANYYTDKTVSFRHKEFSNLIRNSIN